MAKRPSATRPPPEAQVTGEGGAARAAVMTSPEPSSRRPVVVIGALAVLAVIIHLGTIAAQRESMQASLAASDAFVMAANLQARETVMMAHANTPGLDRDVRAGALGEAMALRQGEQGLEAVKARHDTLRAQAQAAAARAGGLGLGEAALLLAILLLAVGEMISSRALARGAVALGGVGLLVALAAALGLSL